MRTLEGLCSSPWRVLKSRFSDCTSCVGLCCWPCSGKAASHAQAWWKHQEILCCVGTSISLLEHQSLHVGDAEVPAPRCCHYSRVLSCCSHCQLSSSNSHLVPLPIQLGAVLPRILHGSYCGYSSVSFLVFSFTWMFCVSSAHFFLTHLKKQQLVLFSFANSRLLSYFIQIMQLFTCHLFHGLHMGKNLLSLFSCLRIHVKWDDT